MTLNPSAPEEVLCSQAAALPRSWLPEAGFVPLTEPGLLEGLSAIEPVWLPRPRAETAIEFKQWIPYVLLRTRSGALAAYPRGGGESRLHGRWSIGVGGHVNRQDSPGDFTGSAGWKTALWQGMRRELREEFPAAATGDPQFLGLIHEAGSPVGQVHLGLVFLQEVTAELSNTCSELAGLRWLAHAAFDSEEWPLQRFELWSQLAYQLLQHTSLGRSAASTLPRLDGSNPYS